MKYLSYLTIELYRKFWKKKLIKVNDLSSAQYPVNLGGGFPLITH